MKKLTAFVKQESVEIPMTEMRRILIIGNSGSGKSWLGRTLSQKMNIPLFHMDHIRWDQSGYEIRRSSSDISKDLDSIKKQNQWILKVFLERWLKHVFLFQPCWFGWIYLGRNVRKIFFLEGRSLKII